MEKNEEIYRAAMSDWIVDSSGAMVRWEFLSKINDEDRITIYVGVCYKHRLIRRVKFWRPLPGSRIIGEVEDHKSALLHWFYQVRVIVWEEYGDRVPFEFRDNEELQIVRGKWDLLGWLRIALDSLILWFRGYD